MPMYNDLPFPLCNLHLPTLALVEDLDLADGLQPLLSGLAGLLTSLIESRKHMTEREIDAAITLLAGQATLCALVLQRWCAALGATAMQKLKESTDA